MRFCPLRCLLIACLAPALLAQDPPATATPFPSVPVVVQNLPESLYGIILVPDLKRLSQHVAEISALFQDPGAAQPTLVDALGGLLKDPGLANLAQTPVIGVIVPGTPMPGLAFIIPTLKPKDYVDAFTDEDLAAEAVGNLVVVTKQAEALQAGVTVAASYAALTAHPGPSDLTLAISVRRLTAAYGPFLKNIAPMFVAKLGPGMAKFMKAELAILLQLGADLDEEQLDLGWSKAGLSIDSTLVARPQGGLFTVFSAPVAAASPTAASQLADRPSFVTLAGSYHPVAVTDYLISLLKSLGTDPELSALSSPDLLANMRAGAAAQTGTFAMQVVPGGDTLLRTLQLFGCSDAKAALIGQQATFAMMSALGLPLTQQTAVRTIGTTPVDRFQAATPTIPGAPAPAAQPPTEMAVNDHFIVTSQEPAALDAVILGKNHGVSLHAVQDFPSGMDGYVDVHLDLLVGDLIRSGPVKGLVDPPHLSHAQISLAWAHATGSLLTHAHVPISALDDLAAFVAAVKAQGQHHAGGAAPATEPVAPPSF